MSEAILPILPQHDRPDGYERLLYAAELAHQAGQPVESFAVEFTRLRDEGLSIEALRYLVCQGYLLHFFDMSLPGQQGRAVQNVEGLVFGKRSCFALSEAGRQIVAAHLHRTPWTGGRIWPGGVTEGDRTLPSLQILSSKDPVMTAAMIEQLDASDQTRPQWEARARELSWNGVGIKKFRVPAHSQETILSAFQEEGWPELIDDPLPYVPDLEPKRRLHDTIRNLNRNQHPHLILFGGDGTGQRIRWSIVYDKGSAEEASAPSLVVNSEQQFDELPQSMSYNRCHVGSGARPQVTPDLHQTYTRLTPDLHQTYTRLNGKLVWVQREVCDRVLCLA